MAGLRPESDDLRSQQNSVPQPSAYGGPSSWMMKLGGALFATIIAPLVVALIMKKMDSAPAAGNPAPSAQTVASTTPAESSSKVTVSAGAETSSAAKAKPDSAGAATSGEKGKKKAGQGTAKPQAGRTQIFNFVTCLAGSSPTTSGGQSMPKAAASWAMPDPSTARKS